MYKLILTAILALFLSACSVTHPLITEYTINTKINNTNLDSGVCSDKSLKVSQAFSTNDLMSLKMNYIQGSYKQFFYSESQWAESPNRAVTFEMIKLLRETKLFKSVQTNKSRSKTDFILETNIEDFMQHFTSDSAESYANIVISLTLLDSINNTILATQTFRSKIKANTLDAHGGVVALNNALEDILVQMRDWLGEVCK